MRALHRCAVAASLAIAALASAAAPAAAQQTAAELRSTGLVGERFDGFMGLVAPAPDRIRSQMHAINIRRRAQYTDLARRRGARLEEVAVAAGCEILSARVRTGHFYMLPDEVWRRRSGDEPVPKPDYCE
jgi:uncharacterized protein YdbL (DUF1318 family)